MTKREVFDVIANVFATVDVDEEVRESVLTTMAKEIESLDRKNAKARERSAARKAEGDALCMAIEGVLTDEPKTINDILAELGDDTLTPAKITARMRKLKDENKIEKSIVKVDGRKLTAYAKVEVE